MLLCPVFTSALVWALKSPITDQTSAMSRPALIAVGRDGRASTTWSHLAEPRVQIQANIKHGALLSKGTICSAEVDDSSRVAWWRGCERVRGSWGGGVGDSNEFHLVGRRQNDSAYGMRERKKSPWMPFFYFRQEELHFISCGAITTQVLLRLYKCARELWHWRTRDASSCQRCVSNTHVHANICGTLCEQLP